MVAIRGETNIAWNRSQTNSSEPLINRKSFRPTRFANFNPFVESAMETGLVIQDRKCEMKIKHDLVLFFISHVTRDRE
jgi:hypothetical protein